MVLRLPRQGALIAENLSGRNVLVVGADGFIGSHLVPQLVTASADVSAVVEKFPQTENLAKRLVGSRIIECDIRSATQVKNVIGSAAPDWIIHLAAAGVSDLFLSERATLRVNLDGAINVLKAGLSAQRIVMARTPLERSVSNVYSASKAAAWSFAQMYARRIDLPVVGAMIFHCYGPGQSPRNVLPAALMAARADQDFPMTLGDQVFDWIYVDDVCAGLIGIAAADLDPGSTVELGTGIGTPLGEVVQKLFGILDPPTGQPRLGVLPHRPGEENELIAATQLSFELTGWRANIDLDAGLRRFAQLHKTAQENQN